jgi:predicted lipoprotein with Yx(FWY)xxD motif
MKSMFRLLLLATMMLIGIHAAYAENAGVKVIKKDSKPVGTYLADTNGMTLYWNNHDSPGKSTCSGPCIDLWPPVSLPQGMKLSGNLRDSDFGTIVREDGTRQSTFRGYPLHYYSLDRTAGDTKGQGILNQWYVIDPSRFPAQDPGTLYGTK